MISQAFGDSDKKSSGMIEKKHTFKRKKTKRSTLAASFAEDGVKKKRVPKIFKKKSTVKTLS